ncbi:Glycopeptide antibiotics resistance protein [Butyrivibrio sp. Su6]|nr:Glycopeptide antibiotics resistance protein [Butyrivibrio sp. Su6]
MINEFARYFRWLVIEQLGGLYISQFQFLFIILCLFIIVPGYVFHVKRKVPWSKVFLVFFTVYYLGVILLIAIIRREPGSRNGGIGVYFNLGISRGHIYSYMYTVYSLLNIALFFPWGLLIVLYRKKDPLFRAVIMTVLVGFITSFGIEILQALTGRGIFELTDLFTNVTGTFAGAMIGGVIQRFSMRVKKKNEFSE